VGIRANAEVAVAAPEPLMVAVETSKGPPTGRVLVINVAAGTIVRTEPSVKLSGVLPTEPLATVSFSMYEVTPFVRDSRAIPFPATFVRARIPIPETAEFTAVTRVAKLA
jgi:hypothetical protein